MDTFAPVPSLVDRVPDDRRGAEIGGIARAAAAVRAARRSTTTGRTPTTRRRQGAVDAVRAFAAAWTQPGRRPVPPRPEAAGASPGSTSTADSASARPTCSPRSGSRRPAASTSAPSSSTPRSSAPSATPQAVELLKGASLLAIDEFELDDPGDTMLMSPAARRAGRHRHPDRGDLEHAAERAGGGPLRRRRLPARDPGARPTASRRADRRARLPAARHRGATPVSRSTRRVRRRWHAPRRRVDDRRRLRRGCSQHLATVHPSRYVETRRGPRRGRASGTCIRCTDQAEALRFVAFVDRLYDAQVAISRPATPLDRGVRRRDARGRLPQEVPARRSRGSSR